MKKLTPKLKRWLLNRARAKQRDLDRKSRHRKGQVGQLDSHIVSAWFGNISENILSERSAISPPTNLDVCANSEDTIAFLDTVRNGLNLKKATENPGGFEWVHKRKTPKGLRRISTYFDYSVIDHMSPAVALVLTADYHRARKIIGNVPPAINFEKWSNAAFGPLFRLGFFEAIGHLEDSEDKLTDVDNIHYLKAISGRSGTDLERIAKALTQLVSKLDGKKVSREIRMNLNNALGEAMVNVSKWAYPDDHDYAFPHLGKFWVSGSVDPKTNMLTVAIYDQGISIPVSFPRQKLKQKALDYLKSLLAKEAKFDFQNDSAYIDCAMAFGNSKSNQEHRGQGLPQLKDVIESVGNGCLTICSRGGIWQYEYGKAATRKSVPSSVGGTLIEWRLQVSNGFENA